MQEWSLESLQREFGAAGADEWSAWEGLEGDALPSGWVAPDYWDANFGSAIRYDTAFRDGREIGRRAVPQTRMGATSLYDRPAYQFNITPGAPQGGATPAAEPTGPAAPQGATPRDLPQTTPTIEDVVEPIIDALNDAFTDPDGPEGPLESVVPAITSTQVYGQTIRSAAESVPLLADRAFEPRTAPSLTGRRRAGRKTLLG